ncbi:cation transporter, partial [Pseudomonas nitroreducens]|uniref:cation transporter n=1 Tax=Pseudomonas nitroreducens TaxID=46680 RepID=UPI003D2D9B6E
MSTFRIEQMDCPTEEALIRSKLEKLPEVRELQFNLLNRTLNVLHAPLAHQVLVEAIASAGMRAEPLATTVSTRVMIAQMDCPTEERLITDKLSGMPGIAALQFNLLQRTLTINHDPDTLAQALSAIRELGFSPQLETE